MYTIDGQSMPVIQCRLMAKDAHASLRLPADLKREIEKVSEKESRPVSSTLELLVRRGLGLYKEDGVLVAAAPHRKRATTKKGAPDSEDDLAKRMADMVAERLIERLRLTEQEDHQVTASKHVA